MKKLSLRIVMIIAVLCGLSLNAASPLVTNVWTGAGGNSDWFDRTNWENNQFPAYSNVVDLTGLENGSQIILTNWVFCGGVVCDGTPTDSRVLYATNSVTFYINGSLTGDALIDVKNGMLSFMNRVTIGLDGMQVLRKKGAGTLRFERTAADKVADLIIEEGCVEPINEIALRYLNVFVTGDGRLGDAKDLSRLFIGSYTSESGAELDLSGKEVLFGYAGNAALPALIRGTGTVVATSGNPLTITNALSPNITYAVREGSVSFGPSMIPVGFWNFEDVSNPGRDAGPLGNNLFASNGVTVVDDPLGVRGKVAYFPKNSALYGAGVNGAIKGLPSGDTAFTVAAWVQNTEATGGNAALFFWGQIPVESWKMFLNRLSLENVIAGFSGYAVVSQPYASAKGQWWHYAVTYTRGKLVLYINGLPIAEKTNNKPDMVPENFSIGRAWSSSADAFSGYLDDAVIVPYALSGEEINSLIYPKARMAAPISQLNDSQLNGSEKFKLGYNGTLRLPSGTQTVSVVAGNAVRGGIEMPDGGCLVMTGTANEESAVYGAGLTGPCDFVKDGTNTALVLTGRLKHTGTTTVKAGRLVLRNAFYANNGLFAAYDFENDSDLGTDVSGCGRNLTNNGVQRVWDAGRGSHVARFSAVSKQDLHGVFRVNDELIDNTDYTVSVWAKPSASCSDNGSFLSFGENGSSSFKQLQFRFGNLAGGKLIWAHWGGTLDFTQIPTTTGSPASAWHHYAAVRDGKTFIVYCDGVETYRVENSQSLSFPAVKSLFIGSYFGQEKNPSRYFDGDMDDMKIYSRALSASDIVRLFAGGEPKIILSDEALSDLPAPVLHYAFEDASNLGCDSSANHFDLSPGGPGTLTTADSILPGRALAFDESQLSYLFSSNKVLSSVIPGMGVSFTVSFWVHPSKKEKNESAYPTFLCWGDPTGNGGIDFMTSFWYEAPWRLRTYLRTKNTNDRGIDLCSNDEISGLLTGYDDSWHHLATVYSPDGGLFNYIDGQFVSGYSRTNNLSGIVESSGPNANAVLFLGLKTTAQAQAFRGLLDEVKIYNVGLSQKQIRQAILLEQNGGLELLPAETDLSVADRAEILLDRVPQTVRSLSGAGRMTVNGRLAVTGVSSFDGILDGYGDGSIVLSEGASLTLKQDLSSFTGRVELAGGTLVLPQDAAFGPTVFAVSQIDRPIVLPGAVEICDGAAFLLDQADGTPYLKTSGPVSVLGGGTVMRTNPKSRGSWILAEGVSVTDRGTDALALRWSVEDLQASARAVFKIDGGRFILSVNAPDTMIFLK